MLIWKYVVEPEEEHVLQKSDNEICTPVPCIENYKCRIGDPSYWAVINTSERITDFYYVLSASVYLASALCSSDFGSARCGSVYATGRKYR
jgi:hypothetical protein